MSLHHSSKGQDRNRPQRPGKAKTPHRNICWHTKDKAWRVIMVRTGEVYEERFSIHKYGSKQAALTAALAYRDKLQQLIGKRPTIKTSSILNVSGTIAVARFCKTNPSGRQYWSWVAQWRDNGRPKTRKFSLLKYGETLARQLAEEARRKALLELGASDPAEMTAAQAEGKRIYCKIEDIRRNTYKI